MVQNKKSKWDGKSRVITDLYRKRFDEIFKKEQDELNESYKQSIRNKKERDPLIASCEALEKISPSVNSITILPTNCI